MNLKEKIKTILRKEFLNEGHIRVPKSEINKAGILMDLINSNLDNYKQNETNFNSPLVDFKNFFKVLDKDGNPINVSVGIYNDKNDVGAARMDNNNNTLLINVSTWGDQYNINTNYFEDLITHELVHSMDPLVRNTDVFSSYYKKKGAEPDGNKFNLSKLPNSRSEFERNYEKYAKSQHEYNAELTPTINKIRRIVKGDNLKIKWLFWILSNIKKYNNVEDLYLNTEHHFENGDNPLFKNTNDYWDFIYDIYNTVKPWSNKPTLYKKFINDLYLGITD